MVYGKNYVEFPDVGVLTGFHYNDLSVVEVNRECVLE
jgi:hypothetical protein